MAVYTHLGSERLAQLIAGYDVGELISAKGIAEGVSNSNWMIETRGAPGGEDAGARRRFVLTMYERRIDLADLPFFLGLLDHLAARGCPVPGTVHDRTGARFAIVDGKAIALIEYLPGVSPTAPRPAQARAVGAALAGMHLASRDFELTRANTLAPPTSAAALAARADDLASIDPALPAMVETGHAIAQDWPGDLPRSIIHADLFPDNVLMLGDDVSGMIDFYFACEDAMAYDLAVTHGAWSFDKSGTNFAADVGRAVVEGYESVRPLQPAERAALPLLAQGACLRFVASRAEDWLDTPATALVERKDPMDFVRRLEFYREAGDGAFR